MTYADYDFYYNTYQGKVIAQEDFKRLALRASERLDALTEGRAASYFTSVPEHTPLQKATCAVAEALQATETGNAGMDDGLGPHGPLVSATVSKQSRSFAATIDVNSADGQAALDSMIARIVSRYLLATGLLYRGSC